MSEQIPESYEFRVAPQLEGVFAVQEESGSTVAQTQVAPNSLRRRIGGRVVAAVAVTAFVTGGLLASVHGSRDQAHEEDGAYTGPNDKIAAITANPNAQWGGDLRGETIGVALPEFNPNNYEQGDFIGVMAIEYAPYDKNTELTATDMRKCEAGQMLSEDKMGACFWQSRTDYFGDERDAYDISVHPLTAGGWGDIDVDMYLDNGPVTHAPEEGEPTVIANHNITPIHTSVEWNGEIYSQLMMGINDYIAEGSTLKIVVASDREGYVMVYTYERTTAMMVDMNDDPDAVLYAPEEGVDLRTYQCWTPGESDFRLAYNFKEISASLEKGSVAQIGETIIGDGHLG